MTILGSLFLFGETRYTGAEAQGGLLFFGKNMEVNYSAMLVCAVLAMAIGALWYGPLFGRKWLEITGQGAIRRDPLALYGVQFILSLVQLYVLSQFINGWTDASGMENAFWIWLGFVMPTVAGLSLWNGQPVRDRFTMFGIAAGYQLVSLLAFGFILELWQ